jgi:hypothetical protein
VVQTVYLSGTKETYGGREGIQAPGHSYGLRSRDTCFESGWEIVVMPIVISVAEDK